jgi:beta-phosphoglucomutase
MLQAIVFDFDGVIADTERLHLRASKAVLRAEGIELTERDYYDRYLGFDDAGMFAAIASDRGLSFDAKTIAALIAAKSREWESAMPGGPVLFPGASDCIRRCAAQVPLAIASGALRHEIDLILARAGLGEYFHAIVSASDALPGKPAPDFYLRALAKIEEAAGAGHDGASMRIAARHCVAIEDSRWGIESAQRAGLRSVAVTHTYAAGELATADLIVNSLDQVTVERLQSLCR